MYFIKHFLFHVARDGKAGLCTLTNLQHNNWRTSGTQEKFAFKRTYVKQWQTCSPALSPTRGLIDHIESKLFLIRIWSLPRFTPCANAEAKQCFIHVKNQFREKKSGSSIQWELSVSWTTQEYINNTLLSNFLSIFCQVAAYGWLKTKENFELLALKVVTCTVAYERWSLKRRFLM